MKPYQERVKGERDELAERIYKLSVFIGSVAFGDLNDKTRRQLRLQLQYMQSYCDVLNERIADFA